MKTNSVIPVPAAVATCRVCGIDLPARKGPGPRRRYCSRACVARRLEPRHCQRCSTPFRGATQRRKFCSHACGYAARRLAPRVCRACGAPFQPALSARHTCSLRCSMRLAASEGRTSSRFHRRLPERSRCVVCRIEFHPRRSETRTCGRKCGRQLSLRRRAAALQGQVGAA